MLRFFSMTRTPVYNDSSFMIVATVAEALNRECLLVVRDPAVLYEHPKVTVEKYPLSGDFLQYRNGNVHADVLVDLHEKEYKNVWFRKDRDLSFGDGLVPVSAFRQIFIDIAADGGRRINWGYDKIFSVVSCSGAAGEQPHTISKVSAPKVGCFLDDAFSGLDSHSWRRSHALYGMLSSNDQHKSFSRFSTEETLHAIARSDYVFLNNEFQIFKYYKMLQGKTVICQAEKRMFRDLNSVVNFEIDYLDSNLSGFWKYVKRDKKI